MRKAKINVRDVECLESWPNNLNRNEIAKKLGVTRDGLRQHLKKYKKSVVYRD